MKWIAPVAITGMFAIPATIALVELDHNLRKKQTPQAQEPDPGRDIMLPDHISRERVFKNGMVLYYE